MEAQNYAEILKYLAELKTGALVVLGLALGVIVTIYYLYTRNEKNKAQEARKLIEVEQENKNTRARMYTDMWRSLKESLEQHSQQAIQIGNEQSQALDRLAKSIEKMGAESARSLQLLHDTNKGLMTTENSIRVIETIFTRLIETEFERIAVFSITTNHYKENRDFIRDRVLSALNDVIVQASKALNEYTMMVRHEIFFPTNTHTGQFELAMAGWKTIEEAHIERSSGSTPDSRSHAEHVAIKMKHMVRQAFKAGEAKAQDIYHRPESLGRN